MLQAIKNRIVQRIFRRLQDNPEDIKVIAEEIDILSKYPEWDAYEERLIRKLLAAHDLELDAPAEKKMFYLGVIKTLESILRIPQQVREEYKRRGEKENAEKRMANKV